LGLEESGRYREVAINERLNVSAGTNKSSSCGEMAGCRGLTVLRISKKRGGGLNKINPAVLRD